MTRRLLALFSSETDLDMSFLNGIIQISYLLIILVFLQSLCMHMKPSLVPCVRVHFGEVTNSRLFGWF